MGREKQLTNREMAAAQGYRPGWWHPYGFVVCPSMYQRADDADYWNAHEALDHDRWRTAAEIAVLSGLDAKRVSRVLRLLVLDSEAAKRGRKYRYT